MSKEFVLNPTNNKKAKIENKIDREYEHLKNNKSKRPDGTFISNFPEGSPHHDPSSWK